METLKEITAVSNLNLSELFSGRRNFLLNPVIEGIKYVESNTSWEQVMCAGYNPQSQKLEAFVNIKQQSGYSGNLCSTGSNEFLRFFIDFKDGAGFQDMGFTSFKVADIPNSSATAHPITYMASLDIDDTSHRRFLSCDNAVIPTLRAVLSWNVAPTSNPNQVPPYGNSIDVDIQLARLFFIPPFYLNEVIKDTALLNLIDVSEPLKVKAPYTEATEVILEKNRKAGVPDHRTLYSSVGSLLHTQTSFVKASSVFAMNDISKLKINISKLIPFFNLNGQDADTTYEELTCVGFNTAYDRLGAVIHVKKNSGFSGNLCTTGSMEHVAFWADWDNNGIFDQYLGTVSLNVHDISNIPDDGLYYNVMLPVDVAGRLAACGTPKIMRVRAVLSWESLPSTTNPDQLNQWGNYKDAYVQLRPADDGENGIHAAIEFVGGAARELINSSANANENLYNYNSISPTADNNRPWGGYINFNGIIHRNGYNGTIEYRILYKNFGANDSTYQTVTTSQTFTLDNLNDSAPQYPSTQTNPEGWFVYEQNPVTGIYNTTNLFATWYAGGLPDATYTARFVVRVGAVETIEDEFSMVICNQAISISPTANASVDFTKDLDLVIDSGDCKLYSGNDVIAGHLRAVHPFVADWALDLQPSSHVPAGLTPTPAGKNYPVTTGETNSPWSLDTSTLPQCGYTVSIGAHTRVILNSNTTLPYYAPKAIGFAKLS